MEKHTMNLKSLPYKALRKAEVKEVVMTPAPTTFNALEWAEENNDYGPNYYVTARGKVMEVIPETHEARGEEFKPYTVGIMFESTPKASEVALSLFNEISERYGMKEIPKEKNNKK